MIWPDKPVLHYTKAWEGRTLYLSGSINKLQRKLWFVKMTPGGAFTTVYYLRIFWTGPVSQCYITLPLERLTRDTRFCLVCPYISYEKNSLLWIRCQKHTRCCYTCVIRLGRKGVPSANTLAYNLAASEAKKKVFKYYHQMAFTTMVKRFFCPESTSPGTGTATTSETTRWSTPPLPSPTISDLENLSPPRDW